MLQYGITMFTCLYTMLIIKMTISTSVKINGIWNKWMNEWMVSSHHLMTVSNLHQYANLMGYYPCSCRRFDRIVAAFPCIFFFCFPYFFSLQRFLSVLKEFSSFPIFSGMSRDVWFSLVPFPVFITLVYKFLVEAKFIQWWSFISSCWILRTRWWETYKIFKFYCC
jgi:hypothetical protein